MRTIALCLKALLFEDCLHFTAPLEGKVWRPERKTNTKKKTNTTMTNPQTKTIVEAAADAAEALKIMFYFPAQCSRELPHCRSLTRARAAAQPNKQRAQPRGEGYTTDVNPSPFTLGVEEPSRCPSDVYRLFPESFRLVFFLPLT